MAWTLPTALFFVAIGLMLMCLTVLELKFPTRLAKGFLPMATTRGDRVFISLLLAAGWHVGWLALFSGPPYPATVLALVTALLVLRWG